MKRGVSIICSLAMVLQLLLGAIPVWAEENNEAAEYTVPESPAVTYNMNVDWKFKKAADSAVYPLASAAATVAKDGKNFYDIDYDDSDWESVSVPHPINAEDSFDDNCYDAGEGGLYRGFMFYRKKITIDGADIGKKMFLEFEAVRQSVYLYVNGELVGYYEAGITAMGFDISDKVKAGENVIAVATDNASDRGQADASKVTKETRPGSPAGSADGIGYQWNTKDFNEVQGGITGNVNLYIKGSVYQTLPLYNNLKTKGNYIYATDFDIREGKATVTVEGEVRNESDEAKNITLEVNVVEKIDPNADIKDEGTDHTKKPYLVASFKSDATNVPVAADKGQVFESVIPNDAYAENPAATSTDTVKVTPITASKALENLKFWSPDSPNLYDVYTILKDGDTVIDVQKTTTGFRKVEYDIESGGLKINDQPVWLTGYAQRSTNEWAVIGVANDWLQDLDMQWIKESNSNFIRWMHVAPKPVQIRSGDKYGVVSAAPAGDKEADADGRTWDQRVEAMRDTMIYFRNSPSVIFWEAGNNAISPDHQKEMTNLKVVLDPNGGRFSGCRTLSSVDQIKAAEYVGTMLNRHASDAKASMASAKKFMPIMETEYAREEAPRRVWDDFSPPDYDYVNKWLGAGASKKDGYDVHDLTSEDFAVVDTRAYNEFYSARVGGPSGTDYYSAAAIMVWSDSNMHNRNTATENCRTSGKVDPVRIKKEAFYALQAAQSKTPKIHIVGHWNYPKYIKDDKENGNYWYDEKTKVGDYYQPTGTKLQRNPKKKPVYVIGSAGLSKVELYINDDLVKTVEKADSNFIYTFTDIDVTQSGKVSAKAYDMRGNVVAEDEIKTAGEAVNIKLTPVTGPDGLLADGSDIAYFDLAVVDKDGNTCPLAYDKINLKVDGKGVLLGGYNSGVGDKNTTGKDYCYAECGTNRIFVRSTREAGDIILSASFDGQSPVTAKVTSVDDLEMEGGLTAKAQRSFEQGQVAQTVLSEVDPLKTLSSVYTADFGDDGNTYIFDPMEDLDLYTMKINGKPINTYTNKPYRPDTTTGVLCDTIKTLEAIKAAGVDINYTVQTEGDLPQPATVYDGSLPMVTLTGSLIEGVNKVDIMNGSTTLIINGSEKNLLNAQIEEKSGELISDIASVIGYIAGVSYSINEKTKTANIIIAPKPGPESPEDSSKAVLEYADGSARVTAIEPIENANLIFASYEGTALKSVSVKKVNFSESGSFKDFELSSDFVNSDDMKVMLWSSKNEPLHDAIVIKNSAPETAVLAEFDIAEDEEAELTEEETEVIEEAIEEAEIELYAETAPSVTEISDVYDELALDYACETSSLTDISGNNGNGDAVVPATIEDGAPDGTKYIKTGTMGNEKWGTYCTESDAKLADNYAGDMMFTVDVRFDLEGTSGIVPRDKGDKKEAGTITFKDGTLRVQKDSKNWNDSKIAIDNTTWYHLAVIGRFGKTDQTGTIYVWKYNGSDKEYLGSMSGFPMRTIDNNNGMNHINICKNTSVDNIRIYKLGADEITISSDGESIKAGETMAFNYAAARQGEKVIKPEVVWEVYDEAGTTLLTDESGIAVNSSGLLTISGNAQSQKITVKATANKDDAKAISASKQINVEAVDTSKDSYDNIVLSAEDDKNTVRAGEPLTIKVAATKGGVAVVPDKGDVNFKIYNAANLRELGNKNITITDEGVLSVNENVVAQTITVKSVNKSGSTSGSYTVNVLPANMNKDSSENAYSDSYAASNACEEYIDVSGVSVKEGSWDGSGYYQVDSGYDFGGFGSDTNADVIYSADMKLTKEGAGWTIWDGGKRKQGLQVTRKGNSLGVVKDSSNTNTYFEIDGDTWYNVQIMCATGNKSTGTSYANLIVYKYDENGNKVNPKTGEAGVPFVENGIAMRNLDESSANHIAINGGTYVDNVMCMYIAPDALELTLNANEVLAGGNIQASTTASRKGVKFPFLSNSLINYDICDMDEGVLLPIKGDSIKVDASGKVSVDAMADAQDVYVRVTSTSGGMSDSKKLTIKSSDIFEVRKTSFEADYSILRRIDITKNFYYDDDVTFVSAVYGQDGNMKAVGTKKAYGDQIAIGDSKISMNMAMPSDFDKVNDRLNVFVVTKLSTTKKTEGADLTIQTAPDSMGVKGWPAFDASSKVIVLVLKPGADENKVQDGDIAYFNQINASDILSLSSGVLPLMVKPEAGMKVKIAGKVNGIHTVAVGTVAAE